MIRILFLTANPSDTAKLKLEEEYDAIKKALTRANSDDRFTVVMESGVAPANLQALLLQHKPDVVHFSGHGTAQGYVLLQGQGEEALSEPVAGETLESVFRALRRGSSPVRCVVLNACFSARVAKSVAQVVECVVGMEKAINDEAAAAFAAGFYLAIGTGASIQAAVCVGCDQIGLACPTIPSDNGVDAPKVEAHFVNPWEYVILQPQRSANPVAGARCMLHGKYLLKKTSGCGPIARTDIMLDVQLERRVVIKTLVQPAARDAFLNEVADLVKVSKHPNIVSIYGAWLDDEPPHYVREYVEGRSLRDRLEKGGLADTSIDFIQQVLAAVGKAMTFAMSVDVWDLGIEPEKVIVQEPRPGARLGLSAYHVVVCPGPGGSDYIRSGWSRRDGPWSRLYAPPEYTRSNPIESDADQANQYRLGLIGYELLIGSGNFRTVAARRSASDCWPAFEELNEKFNLTRRAPSFLEVAIERMIRPNPGQRYPSLDQAIMAIDRNLYVEVARESFARILDDKNNEGKFFRQFYYKLIEDEDIDAIFERKDLRKKQLADPSDANWQKQFDKLKEAIIFLFAFSLLQETGKRTILSPIAQSHQKMGVESDYYDSFQDALLDTVVKCDQKGREINDDDLRRAWKQTIEPGLNYLKKHSTKPPTGNAIPAHPNGNGQPAKPKRQLEGKSATVKNKKKEG